MSSGDTIKSGSAKSTKPSSTSTTLRPKPFIPKRPPAVKSVYTHDDYDKDGNLKRFKEIPLGDQYDSRRAALHIDSGHTSSKPMDPQFKAPATADEKKIAQLAPKDNVPAPIPNNPDFLPTDFPPVKSTKLKDGRYDVQTPDELRAPRDSQYVAVVRTIENHHPDEDQILQHFYLQYVARREGTYNPIEDPPVVLSDIMPTAVVIIDRVFSKDEVDGPQGQEMLQKFVRKVAERTDFDVCPFRLNLPNQVPLPKSTKFKYKHKMIDQIMSEWYESHEESASEILARVEADRKGEAPQKPKWHCYDGISEQGHFGPQTKIKTLEEEVVERPPKQESWAEITERETQEEPDEDDIDSDDDGGKWTTVAKKKVKPKPSQRAAGMRRKNPKKK